MHEWGLKGIAFAGFLGVLIITRTAFGGSALYNPAEDRIEYEGIITIEELYQQIGNGAYLGKPESNKYILHKNMFGKKNSGLDLSNAEFVFDGFWRILAHGKITMNDAVIYSVNGQGLIRCYRGESGMDSGQFGLFANNLRWWETRLEADGNSYSFLYKCMITNSTMEGFVFPTEANILTPYWPNYLAPLSIRMSHGSEIRNVGFKNVIWGLPLDTWQAYSGVVCLSNNSHTIIDTVTFDDINLSLRDNSNVGAIGMWSNHCIVRNMTAKGLNLAGALAEHAQVADGITFSDIILEGENIPAGGLLSLGYNRYGHRGSSTGIYIEKLNNITMKNFTKGIQSITASGFEITDFTISHTNIGADMGMVWMLNASEISYGDAVEPRCLRHGKIENTATGYYLKGTCTQANDGTPIPASWGIVKVYSEDVQIIASDKAITSTWPTRHEFYGLNDTYFGANHDIYITRDDFQINLINCSFDPQKTEITSSADNSYVKDYRLITVRVVNQHGNPVDDAQVMILPENGGEVVGAEGWPQTMFQTDDTGYTSRASANKANSPAVLNWKKTNANTTENYTYEINAIKDGETVKANQVAPGEIFDYQTYGNIITLELPLKDNPPLRAYPNPFNPKWHTQGFTIINLEAQTGMSIFSIDGELIRTLADSDGDGRIVWDGRNESGHRVANGIYLGLIESPAGETRKVKIAVEK